MIDWVEEALRASGGRATILDVAKHIWNNHEADIRASGDLVYEWQYEMRWSANLLRESGTLLPVDDSPRGVWVLAESAVEAEPPAD